MTSNPRIDAVIFDFGGVITSSPFEAYAGFERANGLPVNFLRQVNATNHLDNAWARLERTDIDVAQFDRQFAAESRALGHEVAGARVLALLSGTVRPEMVEALRRLRARLKVGCITNNHSTPPGPGGPDDKQVALALFHHVIESAKIGMRKPDPRIYRLMLDALDVQAEHAVFLDDLGINLKPARELGMKTIKVGEAAPALDELQALVGFPLH